MQQRTYLLIMGLIGGAIVIADAVKAKVKKAKIDPSTIFSSVPIDPFEPFEPASQCDPEPKPGVLSFQKFVMKRYGGTDLGIRRDCGGPCEPCPNPAQWASMSLHHEGRAWDWAQPDHETAQKVVGFLTKTDEQGNESAMARRAGLSTIIYDREIWSSTHPQWRPYEGADPHTSHVHFGFSKKGAAGDTSAYAVLG